jgi:hypothetical protein
VVKRRSGGGLLGDEAALASELLQKKGTESDRNFLYTRFIFLGESFTVLFLFMYILIIFEQ